ncbi:hypothetical protein ACFLX8_00585 [Chloroflexota bacterium]
MIKITEGNHAGFSGLEINLRKLTAVVFGDLAGESNTFTERLEAISGFCT